MRVVIDGRAIGTHSGGDESYTRGLLSSLKEVAGEEDTFPVLISRGTRPPDDVAGERRFPVIPIEAHSQLVRYTLRIPRALAELRPRADLLHCLNYAPPRSPVPVALQVTDLSFVHHPSYFKPDTLLRLNTLVPFLIWRARVVLTISDFCRQDIINTYRVPPEKVFVVPISIRSVAPREPDPDCARLIAQLGVQPPYFLYVGNLHPRKNVARMVRAFTRAVRSTPSLSAHRLVIAGARWWGGSDVERAAREALSGSVIFLGRVTDEDRDRLLMDAEAVLYPSIFEGFGLPPLEAMAFGTPVLSSTRAAMPEVLGDAALLVDPFDVDAIAAGIVALGTNQGLRDQLRLAGPRRAGLYTSRVMGNRAAEAFGWALTGRVAGRAAA